VLVNNAGVSLDPFGCAPSETPLEIVRETYETNVLGPLAVTNAMLGLLRRSAAGRVVNVSSVLASNGLWTDVFSAQGEQAPAKLAYDSSKAALNSATVHYAFELRDSTVKVNAAAPGFVATDINRHRGHLRLEDEESVAVIVRLATLPDDGPSGEFHRSEGRVPW
jgi:NAD(P)-dependent dehydrogenase (short-subunit alcohol dehydrogenase family)